MAKEFQGNSNPVNYNYTRSDSVDPSVHQTFIEDGVIYHGGTGKILVEDKYGCIVPINEQKRDER